MKKVIIALIVLFASIAIILGVIHLRVSKEANITTNKNYVAMGDSVAAGVGIGTSLGDSCSRTDGAYATKIATALDLKLTNIACSGATIPSGILGVQSVDTDSQIHKLFALPNPSVITLTIGANDANWISAIRNCTTGECGGEADKAAFGATLETLASNLDKTFAQLKDHYHSQVPHVYVTGYYNILSPKVGSTLALLGIKSSNMEWISYMEGQLNDTIRNATKNYTFITYVPIDFSGHELYTSDSWLQGLNDAFPLHPNAQGANAIGDQVLSAVKNNN